MLSLLLSSELLPNEFLRSDSTLVSVVEPLSNVVPGETTYAFFTNAQVFEPVDIVQWNDTWSLVFLTVRRFS